MFDNESDQQGTPSQNTAEAPLFANYEMRGWKPSPRLYKIFALSFIFNVLAVFVIGQASLLTTKGCDSPLIGSVCQVLDTVYVGSKLYGTDTDYVDEAYNPTDLSNSDIVYLDLTGAPEPLYYPSNYWEIASPERFLAQNEGFDITGTGGFPPVGPIPGGISPPVPSTGFGLENKPQELPKQKGSVVNEADLPTGFDTDVDGNTGNPVPSGRPGRRDGLGPLSQGKTRPPKPNEGFPQMSPTPKPSMPTVDKLTSVVINRTPLLDLSKEVQDMLDQKKVDLLAKVNVMAKGKLDEEGKIDPATFQFMSDDKSDPVMAELIRNAIGKLSDSGYLQYLQMLSGKDLNMSIVQDDEKFTAMVLSEVESPRRAESIRTLLNLVIKHYKDKKSVPEADQNDKDDLALLNTATVETKGKQIMIKFEITKPEAQALIQKKLMIKPPAEPVKPQSTAQTANTNPNDVK